MENKSYTEQIQERQIKIAALTETEEVARVCYYIMETEVDEHGEYIPCIVHENQSGYHRTDWRWGKDIELAKECARQKNEELGLTEADADKIVCSSMFQRKI